MDGDAYPIQNVLKKLQPVVLQLKQGTDSPGGHAKRGESCFELRAGVLGLPERQQMPGQILPQAPEGVKYPIIEPAAPPKQLDRLERVLIADVLGPDTDVTIEERSNLDAAGPAFIRINGSRTEDLVVVAGAFYDRAWRATEDAVEEGALEKAMSSGTALLLRRLDEMREHLVRVEASTNLLADEGVREAITDKAAEHVLAKRRKAFQTGLQRITEALLKETPKKLSSLFIGEKTAGALGDVLGGVAETVVDETMDVLQDPVEVEE